MILVFETHPVQYHAPVFRRLAELSQVPFHVVYGSDFSCRGYHDAEFKQSFSWDVDLLKGYSNTILTNAPGPAALYTAPFRTRFNDLFPDPRAISGTLALGYSNAFDRHFLKWSVIHRKPLVFRGETSDVALHRNRARRLFRDLCLRALYTRCAFLLPIGTNSRNHYLRLGVKPSRLIDSPYCVDESTFSTSPGEAANQRRETRRRLEIPDEALVILYSGKLSHRKGVDLIPAAVRGLNRETQSRVHVIFLGDGELSESLQAACNSGPGKVTASFVGFQNQRKLSPYYNAADMLVLPSRIGETWGLVVNEALLHGLPCIVSEMVGCHPDLVSSGITGEVFSVGQPASLSKQLERVIRWLGPTSRAACQSRAALHSINHAAEGLSKAFSRIGAQ